MPDGEDP